MRVIVALAVVAAIFALSPARDGRGPAALVDGAVEAVRAALPAPAGLGIVTAVVAGSLGGERRSETTPPPRAPDTRPVPPDKPLPPARHERPGRL